MEKIYYKNLSKLIKHIPKSKGFFVLYNKEEALYVKSTENLNKFIALYTDKDSENESIVSISEQLERIEYLETNTLMEAFLEEQKIIDNFNPLFNKIIKPYYKYVYLGINYNNNPYFKVCDDTTEDYIYLGPFRSSFFINDVLDAFANLFKLPRCQDAGKTGCDRLHENLCLGFCQNRLGEALPNLINYMLLMPNKEIIDKLNEEHEIMLENLNYPMAENLKAQIDLLIKYYKHVLFFHTSKYIEGTFELKNQKIEINNGVLSSYNKLIDDYRKENEALAYDKSEFDHRWIIFDFIFNTNPDYLISKMR